MASVSAALILTGCLHLFRTQTYWREVCIENYADTEITDVSIGPAEHCSMFGYLGCKGAGKVAGVGVQFIEDFPIQWSQTTAPRHNRNTVDLSKFAGLKNRALVIAYCGNGVWKAEPGRELKKKEE